MSLKNKENDNDLSENESHSDSQSHLCDSDCESNDEIEIDEDINHVMTKRQQNCYNNLKTDAKERNLILLNKIYINKDTKYTFKCRKNKKHIFSRVSSSLRRCTGCNLCPSEIIIESEKKCNLIIKEKGGKIVLKYKNNITHMVIICKNGHKFKIIPHDIKANRWCPDCPQNKPRSSKECKKDFLERMEKEQAELLEEFTNMKTYVKVQCRYKHFPFNCMPCDYIHSGRWCPGCAGICPKQAEVDFFENVDNKGGFVLNPDEYMGVTKLMKINCGENNHVFEVTPASIKSGSWCPECPTISTINAKNKFYYIIETNKGKALTPFISTNDKVEIDCGKDHVFHMAPRHVNAGQWCTLCNQSKGERKISNILKSLNLGWEKYRIGKLEYDFYIEDKDLFIEWDGIPHFKMNEFFHKDGEYKFEESRQRDIIKNQIIKNNDWKLLRIDYKFLNKSDDVIIELINDALNSLNNITYSNREMYKWMSKRLPNEIYKKYDVKPPRKIKIIFDE
jgi:very-short-patch-repair endonuclease